MNGERVGPKNIDPKTQRNSEEVQYGGDKIMSDKQRIVIAEDHTILREGLRALLSSDPELEVVGEAEDGQEAIRVVEKFKPGLVLMDLSMPRMNGMDAIREIKKRSPETKVLVLTVHKTDEYILATLQAGADGYVLKDSTNVELRMAIKNVLIGKFFISPGISGKVIEGYLENKRPLKPSTPWETLTARERGILKLIAEGYKNKEIGEFLCISVKTVEKHRANLMQKLDLHSVSALTALAIEKGLITK
jgi:two-component system response regulator NreC